MINSAPINSAVINSAGAEVRFVDALPVVWVSTRYRCYLTGAENGLATDIELPISSFQTRLRNDGISSISCVLKGADAYIDAIAARDVGLIKIYREYVLSDGSVSSYLMAKGTFETLDLQSGGRAGTTGTITAMGNFTPSTNETIALTHPTYYARQSNKRRYRCAINPNLRPGDTALINEDSLVVNEIIYVIDVTTATMEIAEA